MKNRINHTMKTRNFRRLIRIGRLPAAIVMVGTLGASALGQPNNGNSPNTQAAQELNNVQRLIQQGAATGGFGSSVSGDAGSGIGNAPVIVTTGPTFDLEVSGNHFVRAPGDTKGPIATVGTLVTLLQEKVTNFNAIQSAGVSEVPLNNFKLREVNIPTVLNILPSITDNKVQARTLVGGRGRRGGPGAQVLVGPGMPTGAVYMLEPVPPALTSTDAGSSSGSSAPAAPDAPARQMAVFNINNYLADLARHGKTDEKAIGSELMDVETMIGDSLERLKGSPLAPDERPQFEVHYGAGIVVVIGSARAIDVATKIIRALPGAANNTGPTGSATMLSSDLFQRLDSRTKDYFTSHPESWNDYVKAQGGGNENDTLLQLQQQLKASADSRMEDYNRTLRALQSLPNSPTNQPSSAAPVPAPRGGQ